MIQVSIFAVALMAAPSPTAGTPFPSLAALQDALNDLEKCPGPTGPGCPEPERRYKVDGAKCMTIPPEGGRPSVTCRVDLTLTYADPKHETTRHHDSCLRLARLDSSGDAPDWTVLQIRDRPCEMPSALKGDPNRIPKPAELERALVGKFTCYDFDGITHCGPQPERAAVEAFECKPIPPGEERDHRVACRVTAGVAFSGRRRYVQRLENECVRLDRITEADRSPAHLGRDLCPR